MRRLRYKGAMKPKNIPALTGLRFFAAMAIVLWHSQTGYFFKYGAFSPFYLAGAVPVFFVLSGFVLTISAGKYKSWSDFFVARIARIWPTHIAALMLVFLILYPYSLDFFYHADTLRRLALNVLLLQAWSPNMATYWSYNDPSWSVSCEMFFYAVFPLTVAFLSRQTAVRLIAIVAAIFCGIVLTNKAYPHMDLNWLGAVDPPSCFPAFAIGVAAGIWHKSLRDASPSYIVGTSVQAAALAMALWANAFFISHQAHITPGANAFIWLFGPSPFYAAFIVVLARYDGAISRALSLRLIVYGGEISYAIYMFHQIFIRWHAGHLAKFNGIPIWWQYAGLMTAVLATSIAAHHLIEKPARRRILAVWRSVRSRPQRGIAADTAD
jgi:peptidoglycan/LPS O-acetylase OafA/YrhL